jgi:hypothetical protein
MCLAQTAALIERTSVARTFGDGFQSCDRTAEFVGAGDDVSARFVVGGGVVVVSTTLTNVVVFPTLSLPFRPNIPA